MNRRRKQQEVKVKLESYSERYYIVSLFPRRRVATVEQLKPVKRGGIIAASFHFSVLGIGNLPAEEATQTNLSAPSSLSDVYAPSHPSRHHRHFYARRGKVAARRASGRRKNENFLHHSRFLQRLPGRRLRPLSSPASAVIFTIFY